MPPTRLLFTAFGSFPGARVNPTSAIARLVLTRHGRRLSRLGLELHTAELPVIFAGAEERARDLIENLQPDAVLHLGLAGRRKRLSFEVRARNRLNVLHPDAARARAERLLIEQGGPAFRPARAPIARCVHAIAATGAACARSIDAGDYLCNQTLFASLGSNAPVVAFLHVPRPRRLRTKRRKHGSGVTLAQMAEGAVAALLVMAWEARRVQRTPSRTGKARQAQKAKG